MGTADGVRSSRRPALFRAMAAALRAFADVLESRDGHDAPQSVFRANRTEVLDSEA
jgi:hypothetical protein